MDFAKTRIKNYDRAHVTAGTRTMDGKLQSKAMQPRQPASTTAIVKSTYL